MEGSAAVYCPRGPEQALLYKVVARELETFLALQQERDRPVPEFVEDEFRSFLECGVLEYGFLRLRCDTCQRDRLLPFSCKGRCVCSSCCGRRMADTAAHLVDRMIPAVPVRQWVLSLPFALRYRVAFDGALLGKVLGIFSRAVTRRNYAWASLMVRVFQVDVLECFHCKGRVRILAAIHPPENTRKILDCLGLPPGAPPVKLAAAKPNLDPY